MYPQQHLYFICHFDITITKIVGFAFPNSKTKNCVKVSVQLKDLLFCECDYLSAKSQLIGEVKSTYAEQCSIAKKLTYAQPNPAKKFVPYSDADLQMLQRLL